MKSMFVMSRSLARRALTYEIGNRQRITIAEPLTDVLSFQKVQNSTCSQNDSETSRSFHKPHKIPRRLDMYWSLNDDVKRKIVDPTYVKEAVQDTFMQRANGEYCYRKHKQPQRGSKNIDDNFETPAKKHGFPKQALSAFPPVKRKGKNIKPKGLVASKSAHQELLRPAIGLDLRVNSMMQLETVRKKLHDNGPNVLDYMMSKQAPKFSDKQLKSRKDKYLADTKEPRSIFNWGKKKNTSSNSQDDLTITPRSIEVKKHENTGKIVYEKLEQGKHEEPISKKKKSFWKNYKNKKNIEIISAADLKHRKAQEQVLADRQAILNKIKSVVTPPDTNQEVRRLNRASAIELTPQIYPRGSLSLKKSYLPIEPCPRRSKTDGKLYSDNVLNEPRKDGTHKNQPKTEVKSDSNLKSMSFVQKFKGSLKSFFASIVPSAFR